MQELGAGRELGRRRISSIAWGALARSSVFCSFHGVVTRLLEIFMTEKTAFRLDAKVGAVVRMSAWTAWAMFQSCLQGWDKYGGSLEIDKKLIHNFPAMASSNAFTRPLIHSLFFSLSSSFNQRINVA